MVSFELVFSNILVLLVCMVVGFICRKTKLITDEINNGLSGLLIYVTMPCMIITSMQRPFDANLLMESILVFFVTIGMFLFGTIIALLFCKIFRIAKTDSGVYLFAMTMPNVGYMGFPIINAIYGQEALFYVSIASIAFNIIAFTFGIKLIHVGNGKASISFKKIITNTAIISTCLGLILFIFSIQIPSFLNQSFSLIGNMTTPLSMMIVGAILAKNDLRLLYRVKMYYVFSFLKLLLVPTLAYFILRMFIKDELILGVLVFLIAMPAANLTAIFSEQYNTNPGLASNIVCITTVLSVITIPIISLLLK